MGIGDEIMATAQARQLRATDPRRVRILDRYGNPRWHEAWWGNPHIADPIEVGDFQMLANGPGVRPYIAAKTSERWTWQRWDIEPGDIYLKPEEREWAKPYAERVIIEPHIKPKASPNKDWGWVRWSKLVYLAQAAGIRLTQIGADDRRRSTVMGADYVETKTIRQAFALIASARAVVTTEGAIHHAAAALGIPAVVIFGGYIAPDITGYSSHINLFSGGEACGNRKRCDHCVKAMAQITPERVLKSLQSLLAEQPAIAA
jgi:ADP-heptose:LPS heptosyltransferase